ncbi:MAG: hypothetical protein P8X74_17875 [Reinekea sp.]
MFPKNWGEPMGAPAIFGKQTNRNQWLTLCSRGFRKWSSVFDGFMKGVT